MFRSFHPSYAQSAATSAAMNPANPPFAPEKMVAKLCHVPSDAVNASSAMATMITIFSTVNTTWKSPARLMPM